jgi:ribonuclease HII
MNMLNGSDEKTEFEKGYFSLGAIDEAGRGPLAGPVVAACVILTPDIDISALKLQGIKDSKLIPEKKREKLFEIVLEFFPEVGIGICSNETIDRINILQATFLAMKKAISSLKKRPEMILLDGRDKIPKISISQKSIIGGDRSVLSIAAASIVAKVSRDRIMREMHLLHPEYNFLKHKGYGTREHLELLKKFGPCPIHRFSFAPVSRLMNG